MAPGPAPTADAASPGDPDPHHLGAALGRIMGGSRRTAKAAALVAATCFEPGEQVRVALGGRFRARDGVVVLTNRRLVLANNREWDPELVSLELATVEVEQWVERRAATLRFTTADGVHVVDRVNDLGIAEALVRALRPA